MTQSQASDPVQGNVSCPVRLAKPVSSEPSLLLEGYPSGVSSGPCLRPSQGHMQEQVPRKWPLKRAFHPTRSSYSYTNQYIPQEIYTTTLMVSERKMVRSDALKCNQSKMRNYFLLKLFGIALLVTSLLTPFLIVTLIRMRQRNL